MKLRIPLFLILSFCVVTTSNAVVGTIDDVIEATRNGEEPAYIEELMGELAQELQQDDRQFSPNGSLAWFIVMTHVLNSVQSALQIYYGTNTHGSTLKSAVNALNFPKVFGGWDCAHDKIKHRYQNILGFLQRGSALNSQEEQRFNNEDILKRPYFKFRVMQWKALNNMVSAVNEVIGAPYATANEVLDTVKAADNPFVSHTKWLAFYNEHLAVLDAHAFGYLAPWLARIVPIDGLTADHQDLMRRANPRTLEESFLPANLTPTSAVDSISQIFRTRLALGFIQ